MWQCFIMSNEWYKSHMMSFLNEDPSDHILIYFWKFLPWLLPATILYVTYPHILLIVENFTQIIFPLSPRPHILDHTGTFSPKYKIIPYTLHQL